MAVQTDVYLKGKFDRGKYPTSTDYADLIDSCINSNVPTGAKIIVASVGKSGNYSTDNNGVYYIDSFLYNSSANYCVLTSSQTTELHNGGEGTCVIVLNAATSPIVIRVEDHFKDYGDYYNPSNPVIETREITIMPGGSVMLAKVGMHYSGGYIPVVSLVGTAIQSAELSISGT